MGTQSTNGRKENLFHKTEATTPSWNCLWQQMQDVWLKNKELNFACRKLRDQLSNVMQAWGLSRGNLMFSFLTFTVDESGGNADNGMLC